jgi:integrase
MDIGHASAGDHRGDALLGSRRSLVRRGKGGRRREGGMDDWGFEQLQPWLLARQEMPVGPLFCVIDGRTQGSAWYASAARAAPRRHAARADVRRRFAPHQLRHAHAIELAREACRSMSSSASSGTATPA